MKQSVESVNCLLGCMRNIMVIEFRYTKDMSSSDKFSIYNVTSPEEIYRCNNCIGFMIINFNGFWQDSRHMQIATSNF